MAMTWYQMNAGRFLLEVTKAKDAKDWLERSMKIAEALITRTRGIDAWADQMIQETEEYSETKAKAAAVRWGKKPGDGAPKANPQVRKNAEQCKQDAVHHPCNAEEMQDGCRGDAVHHPCNAIPTDRPTDKHTDIHTDRPTETRARARGAAGNGGEIGSDGSGRGSKEPGQPEQPPDGSGQSWDELAKGGETVGEMIAGCPEADLPGLACWLCLEDGNPIALKAYRKAIRRTGSADFRQALAEFASELHQPGGEPESRGRAFMARVREMVERSGGRRDSK